MPDVTRYAPEYPFPPYAYVPGRQPHPVSDPRGHSHPDGLLPDVPLDPADPFGSRPYRFGIDLFNAGFYWEAHEAWEQIWRMCDRRGPAAVVLQALIKLAAAGVKARSGNPNGVVRHSRRAAELFRRVASAPSPDLPRHGPALEDLIEAADRLTADPPLDTDPCAPGKPVLGITLRLW